MNTLAFCTNCRKEIEDLEGLLFVEENSDRGFCSEDCIHEFYSSYLKAFEKLETQYRNDLELSFEDEYDDIISNEHFLNKVLSFPDFVYCWVDRLEKPFYIHFLKLDSESQLYFVAICSYVENQPSFVFYRFVTSHIQLVEKFKIGEEYDGTKKVEESVKEQQEIPSEVLEEVEQKKSQLLAEFMVERKVGDIPFEDFANYDSYFEKVFALPDEVYEFEDEAGDSLNVLIKSFQLGDVAFFYAVIAYPYILSEKQVHYIPIIGIPSVDEELYMKFSKGKRLDGFISN